MSVEDKCQKTYTYKFTLKQSFLLLLLCFLKKQTETADNSHDHVLVSGDLDVTVNVHRYVKFFQIFLAV